MVAWPLQCLSDSGKVGGATGEDLNKESLEKPRQPTATEELLQSGGELAEGKTGLREGKREEWAAPSVKMTSNT